MTEKQKVIIFAVAVGWILIWWMSTRARKSSTPVAAPGVDPYGVSEYTVESVAVLGGCL